MEDVLHGSMISILLFFRRNSSGHGWVCSRAINTIARALARYHTLVAVPPRPGRLLPGGGCRRGCHHGRRFGSRSWSKNFARWRASKNLTHFSWLDSRWRCGCVDAEATSRTSAFSNTTVG